jgi:hypothetical protein
MKYPNTSRRGVLLLVILGLLAMFAMVAVAFVVLTNFYRQSGELTRHVDEAAEPPDRLLDQGMRAIVRGSNVPTSAIHSQSLLEKIYGHETTQAAAFNTSPAEPTVVGSYLNGQLLEFTAAAAPVPSYADAWHRIGCVLTVLDGPAAGLSTRIVGVNPNSGKMQIMAFEGGVVPQAGNHYVINGVPYGGLGFGYNPGTLALDATATVGGLTCPVALLPFYTDTTNNPRVDNWSPQSGDFGDPDPSHWNPPGGANGDCTVPDFQDPVLGFQVPNPHASNQLATPLPSLHRPELMMYWAKAASISNPQTLASWAGYPDLTRAIMARPNPADHPIFCTYVNPGFNPVWDGVSTAPAGSLPWSWDVCNDGDGIADSVWVDLGFPVRYLADGKAYKPLFAILVVDLDGRLNLNAHGSWAQTTPDYQNANTPAVLDSANGAYTANTTFTNAWFGGTTIPGNGNPTPLSFLPPRGQGFGTAEINLGPLLNQSQVQTLLQGISAQGLPGRYGWKQYPGSASSALCGGVFLSANQWYNYNGYYWQFLNNPGYQCSDAFRTPPDTLGLSATAVDFAGRPLYAGMGKGALSVAATLSGNSVTINNPYALDLSRNALHASTSPPAWADDPFGPAELEPVLRACDRDAPTLPNRLLALSLGGTANMVQTTATPAVQVNNSPLVQKRWAVTTTSFNVPTPAMSPPAIAGTSSATGGRARHIVDLLIAKGVPAGNAKILADLLPPEMLAGLKMNLNRPLGAMGVTPVSNDTSNQTNETVSQYSLATTSGQPLSKLTFNYYPGGTSPFNTTFVPTPPVLSNSGKLTPADALAARQIYAKHLYILAMLLMDTGALSNQFGGGQAGQQAAAQLIAQWAINVVSFRDSHAVMIPFHYDPNFVAGASTNGWANGWNPPDKDPTPGNPQQPGTVWKQTVWSCNRPELLLSKTLGLHDRRSEDLNTEQVDQNNLNSGNHTKPGMTTDASPNQDPNFDQRLCPQGSLFFELYNPSAASDAPSAELHATSPSDPQHRWGIQLDKMSASGKTPIWRLIVVDGSIASNPTFDPDAPANAASFIERSIYFNNPGNAGILKDGIHDAQNASVIYYSSRAATSGAPIVLLPDRYAVVGPDDDAHTGTTLINKRTDGTWRTIVLAPNANPDAPGQVKVNNNNDSPPTVQAPMAVTIDQTVGGKISQGPSGPRRLSVSEPIMEVNGGNSYPPNGPDGTTPYVPVPASDPTSDPNTGYSPAAYDIPFDSINASQQHGVLTDPSGKLCNTGSSLGYKKLYLQRLANPWQDYDPIANPYRTVDAMPVDITAYNGVVNHPDPQDKAGSVCFRTRERGSRSTQADPNILWPQEPWPTASQPQPDPQEPAPTVDFFPYQLLGSSGQHQTLGYLNTTFPYPVQPPGTAIQPCSTGPYVGDPVGPAGSPALAPFPWLNWNHRPYVSPLELLLVPCVRSSQLLNAYAFPSSGIDSPLNPYQNMVYPHLLSFFFQGASAGANPPKPPQYHRVLDYLGVPSPFVQMETLLNPNTTYNSPSDPSHPFHTPFNRVPTYREPGRINLNTIPCIEVLWGLSNYFPGMGDPATINNFWAKFVQSRHGATKDASGNSLPDDTGVPANSPTRFGNPFRSFAGGSLALSTTALGLPKLNQEIDATLLRSAAPADAANVLFQSDPTDTNKTYWKQPATNATRNPYFRYLPLERLGNLTSTRSNVFAIWITVGYFEVLPWPNGVDAGHPDGFQLGQELGSDTGKIERHRAFYIFDRSIPVGFIRGRDVNQDKALLLRRFIE